MDFFGYELLGYHGQKIYKIQFLKRRAFYLAIAS